MNLRRTPGSKQSERPLPADYQRFLHLGSNRPAQLLESHERGYRSGVINTDCLGMRYSHFANRRFSLAECAGASRVNLLVGGSAALGIGASCDEHTVASQLAGLTGELWLSLAGCGFDASQELLMFLQHQHRFGEIGHVVILSGINSLAQDTLAEIAQGSSDPQHAEACQRFLKRFRQQLPEAAKPEQASLLRRLHRVFAPHRETPWPTLAALTPADKRMARSADRIGRTLCQWERLLGTSHSSLTFILQPLLPWCRGALPAAEQRMLEALGQRPGMLDRLLGDIFDPQLHPAFFRRIKHQAEPVACYDMNSMLSSSPMFGEKLFIDRLHLNDLGNNALAKVITAKLGLAQEKHALRRLTPIKLV